jgi:hypothetical protein
MTTPRAAHVTVLETLLDRCKPRESWTAEREALTAAVELMRQAGEDIDDGGPYNGIDWRATAHELLSRLETASPPNVLVQQLSILRDMAALLRCMFPTAPTEASRPMTPQYMAEVVQATIECLCANGFQSRTHRLAEVRDQLAALTASPQVQGVEDGTVAASRFILDRAMGALTEALMYPEELRKTAEWVAADLRRELAKGAATPQRAPGVTEGCAIQLSDDDWNPYELLDVVRHSLAASTPAVIVERIDECLRQQKQTQRAAPTAPVSAVGVDGLIRRLTELSGRAADMSWDLEVVGLHHATAMLRKVAALASGPSGECPSRERCDCLGRCKYGFAGNGAAPAAQDQGEGNGNQ